MGSEMCIRDRSVLAAQRLQQRRRAARLGEDEDSRQAPLGSLGVEGGERGGVGERLDVRRHRRRRKTQQITHLALLLVLDDLLLVRRRAALWHEGLDRRRALDLAERRRRVGSLLCIPIRDLDLVLELAGQLLPLGREQRAEASGLPAHVHHPQMRRLLQHRPVRRRERLNVGGERV